MDKQIRDNSTIFNELEELTSTSGFIHLICSLDFFSNSIIYEENKGLTPTEINELKERELPIRSEMCILIGLICKHGSFDKKGHSITLGFTNNDSTGIIFHTNHVEFIYAKRYFRKCFEHMIKKHKFTNNYGIYFDSNTKEIKSYIL